MTISVTGTSNIVHHSHSIIHTSNKNSSILFRSPQFVRLALCLKCFIYFLISILNVLINFIYRLFVLYWNFTSSSYIFPTTEIIRFRVQECEKLLFSFHSKTFFTSTEVLKKKIIKNLLTVQRNNNNNITIVVAVVVVVVFVVVCEYIKSFTVSSSQL